jgi:hypothetical protein
MKKTMADIASGRDTNANSTLYALAPIASSPASCHLFSISLSQNLL